MVRTMKDRPARPKKIVRNPERPSSWTCGECGLELGRRDSLLRHVRLVHNAPYTLVDTDRRIGKPWWDEESPIDDL